MTNGIDRETIESSTDDLVRLREVAREHAVGGVLEAVREFLGMDVAYATEMTESEQLFRVLSGDGDSFGVSAGAAMPVEQTYCHRVLSGRLPNVIGDVRGDDRAASLPVTEAADVGAFVSVPLQLSDGRLFGTLCAASHRRRPDLGYRELQFLHVFARLIADQLEREALQRKAHELSRQVTATAALVGAVEARDAYTAEHSRQVVDLAVAVAQRLALDEATVDDVARVAMLHDIGKISIPDAILLKPGPLDEEEWEKMRCHPVYGARLIATTPGLEHLAVAVEAEHEHWDGGGYPNRLCGEEIPIASRITLACDAYHAMTSDRPYRKALPEQAARRELADNAGGQFDPAVVRALLDVLGQHRPSRPWTAMPEN